ncbi:MAG: ABC transporter permease [Gammaproteobacteria bacterium]|nr:ABC transporter permease [Gammaproteobacteria bacterium]
MERAAANAVSENRHSLKRLVERFPFLPALLIMLVLLGMTGVLSPGTVSYRGLTGLLSTYLALMLLSVAQTYVVFAADIDLSAGAIVSLVNVSVVLLMQAWGGETLPVLAALGIGLLIGALCGLLNGIVVALLRLQAIVATFASSIFFTGLALYILPVAGAPVPRVVWRTFGGKIYGVPFVFYVVLLVGLLLYMLSRTRLVLQLLAVGDDAQSAFQSGLAVTVIRIKAYVVCGIFSALAAFCIIGDTASGDPLVGGKMTLLSVAAVVLGGSALSGGVGTVLGSVIGALTIGLINAFVYFAGTPSEWQNFVQGLVILIALMLGVLVSRRART